MRTVPRHRPESFCAERVFEDVQEVTCSGSIANSVYRGLVDDAYGRVTNPGRYRLLHDAAEAVLADLENNYQVTRTDVRADAELTRNRPASRVERLTPVNPGGAPATVAFTDFPGLMIRLGRWRVDAFPHCGCDACDEDPQDLAETMSNMLRALALGNFSESVTPGTPPTVSYKFIPPNGHRSGSSTDFQDSRIEVNPGVPEPPAAGWQPWVPRQAR